MTDTISHDAHIVESVSPSLNLGAVGAWRSTWLGPAWAALCGLVASSSFSFDGPNVLAAAFVLLLSDWVWPAVWTTCVRTDWAAPLEHWPQVTGAGDVLRLPYFQKGAPGDRMLSWLARARAWRRAHLMPTVGASLTSLIAALGIGLAVSVALGWRALLVSLLALALTGLGTLRALRAAIDPDGLRAMVYGTLSWWLGHLAFAPLTLESAGMGLLFGLAYRAMMASGDDAPSALGLFAAQILAAVTIFAGASPAAGYFIFTAVVAQAALRSFLGGHGFARRAQAWLMIAMILSAAAIA